MVNSIMQSLDLARLQGETRTLRVLAI